jgi:Leucine-rich repeat (LRR) protein
LYVPFDVDCAIPIYQGLTAMDNLVLPNLRELFLHRNAITKIGNLGGCPRLRKLWLFQNQLETVTGLHAVPELSECWLQSNQISKLSGFETLNQLHNLGLAGNQITDFKEMKRLSACPGLRNLSMSDIHFGRCPIADEAGYQEFIVLHLPQVTTLDGISITKETQLSAEDLFYSQVTYSTFVL